MNKELVCLDRNAENAYNEGKFKLSKIIIRFIPAVNTQQSDPVTDSLSKSTVHVRRPEPPEQNRLITTGRSRVNEPLHS